MSAIRALTRRLRPIVLLCLAVAAGSLPAVAAEDAGAILFARNCAQCHEVGEGARHKVGPHLDRLFGRVAGTVEGFRYSKAMGEAGIGGLSWTPENLAAYLERPRDFIPGNRMSFRGFPDAADRDAVIAWLKTASAVAPAEDPAKRAGSEQVTGFADIVLQIEGDPAFGEYLAGECVTCHQASGHADGIPSIVGLPKDYFVRALFEYRTNVRSNEVMKLRVANLANDEIAALAAYFSGLSPQ